MNDKRDVKAEKYLRQGIKLKENLQCEEALERFQRALEIHRNAKSIQYIAFDLCEIAECHRILEQYDKSEHYFLEAIAIFEKEDCVICDEYADAIFRLARLYGDNGRFELAEKNYLQSIDVIERAYGCKNKLLVKRLNYLGSLYSENCKYAEADACLNRALKIAEDEYGQAHVEVSEILLSLGLLYNIIGPTKADIYLKRALEINEGEYGSNHIELSVPLTGLGLRYVITHEYNKAEPLLKRALKITKSEYGSKHSIVSYALSNLSQVYRGKGNYNKFIHYLEMAKKIRGDDIGLQHLDTLSTDLAWGYQEIGRYEEAEKLHRQALSVAESTGNQFLMMLIYYGLSCLYSKTGKSNLAIFLGKQAVNTIQDIRGNISNLGKDVLKSHQTTVEEIFKYLSGLLVDDNRFAEAEQVMNLLKQYEYFDYIRRDAASPNEFLIKITYTEIEAICDHLYRKYANKLVKLSQERQQTTNDSVLLSSVDQKLEAAKKDFQKVIDQICIKLSDTPKEKCVEIVKEESSELMLTLRELGHNAVALYPFSTKETFHLMLITPEGHKPFSSDIHENVLRNKIFAFRQSLIPHGLNLYNPLKIAQELYDIVIGPIIVELQKRKAKTLLWSLEGPMRYIPVAALHDGEKYLVESFSNVMFTPSSKNNLKDEPQTIWKGLGLGVTKDHPPFAALPEVENELKGIIGSQDAGDAVFRGTVKLDKNFNWESMCGELKRKYPLVHIASHFQCAPGNDTTSFLLLGDGEHLTMDKLRSQANLFKGVDLLTLSACNTAVGNVGQDGKEVECFGVLAQRQGAKAIVASLWPVADASTSLIMKEFYKQRAEGKTKAEALQTAQIALLNGNKKSNNFDSTSTRSSQANRYTDMADSNTELYDFERDEDKPFAHPYFWAPFILIGNWK
ncbi:MAG TPA: CHAT domain-containing protein [Smithellaceae bacterium]|nr:CHAT domain-containing protein [Smithellaceae bacterium]